MVAEATQLTFVRSEFSPVTAGGRHYVPAVQNKHGELQALSRASAETWSNLTPLVQIVGPKTSPNTYRRETVFGWIKRIAEAVGTRPCFLDVARMNPERPTTTSQGERTVLSVIHEAARKHALAFVPVVPVSGQVTKEHVTLARRALALDGRGVALRYKPLHVGGQGRLPTFGDYVIQHPAPPQSNGGPGMRANIRYTSDGVTLVARARGPVIVGGREQYRELCQQLVVRPEFAGSEFSWGDSQISACARGEINPGTQNLWRGVGSSHHFRLVTEEVSR